MKKPATVLLALCLATAVMAQETVDEEPAEVRRYVVEVIVFEYTEDVFTGSEIFPPEEPEQAEIGEEPAATDEEFADGFPEDGGPYFGDAPASAASGMDGNATGAGIDAQLAPLSTIDALLLPAGELSMDSTFAQMQRLDVYRTLLYAGWEQDSQPKEDAEPIPLSFFGQPPEGLEGSFTLYLGRYLHLIVDLGLDAGPAPGMSADDPWSAEPRETEAGLIYGDARLGWDSDAEYDTGYLQPRIIYRISDDRILRNGETRYFDHPKFGVIARISRVEKPEQEAQPGEPLPLIGGSSQ